MKTNLKILCIFFFLFKTPALFAGVADGVIEQVTQYPQLIKMGYEVATKAEVREGLWNAVKNVSPSSVYNLAESAVKDKIEKYNFDDKPYLGYHELGKDGVRVVSMIMGAGFFKKGADNGLEKGVKETGEEIGKKGVSNLLDKELIKTLKEKGIKFTEEDLTFVSKNSDGFIMFLEKGSSSAGLQHIIERHWNATELMKFFNTQDDMVNALYHAIKNEKYISRVIDSQSRLSYVYKVFTKVGSREFTIATGDNGFIVSFIPK